MSVKLCVFDWDGTLCDSTHQIAKSVQVAAEFLQWPVPSYEDARSIIGLGLKEAFKTLFPQGESADLSRFVDAYRQDFLSYPHAELYPGAADVLQTLKDRGFKLAVATGKSRAGLDHVMQGVGLSGMFDVTRCADESRSKPDPTMLYEILTETECESAATCMIGDTSFDMEMGKRAGVHLVGITHGAHSANVLERFPLNALIDQISELAELPLLQS